MKNIDVAVIMGSDSDLPVMADAAKILEEFSIPFEVTIASAHRSPNRTVTYAKSLLKRGCKVVIAGAGGAAHLPGVIAALTPLPVIGVPMITKTLSGIDSLYSIVQMPPGIPVATVGIGSAKNAALLAVRILAIQDRTLMSRFLKYITEMEHAVNIKAEKLEKIGYKEYLERNK